MRNRLEGHFRHFRCAVLDSGNSDIWGGCPPATRIDLNPTAKNQAALFLEFCGASSSRFFKKCRENELREALAATEQARNGSTGSSIMAQYLAAANIAAECNH